MCITTPPSSFRLFFLPSATLKNNIRTLLADRHRRAIGLTRKKVGDDEKNTLKALRKLDKEEE